MRSVYPSDVPGRVTSIGRHKDSYQLPRSTYPSQSQPYLLTHQAAPRTRHATPPSFGSSPLLLSAADSCALDLPRNTPPLVFLRAPSPLRPSGDPIGEFRCSANLTHCLRMTPCRCCPQRPTHLSLSLILSWPWYGYSPASVRAPQGCIVQPADSCPLERDKLTAAPNLPLLQLAHVTYGTSRHASRQSLHVRNRGSQDVSGASYLSNRSRGHSCSILPAV